MIILIDAEKTFYKIYPFVIKMLNKLGIEVTYLNIIKATGSIILNGARLKTFPLTSGTRQECPLFRLLFNTVVKQSSRKK